MSPADDFPGEMPELPLDDRDPEAVFGATPGTNPVPDELRDIADLVHVARRAGSSDELVDEAVIVAQIATVIGEPGALPSGGADERTRVLTKFHAAKLTAAATALLVFGATAAAATGSLPAPVQDSVAKGLSGVGISVPAHHPRSSGRHADLAAQHTMPGGKGRHHGGDKKHAAPGAFGAVAAVNGTTVAGTCGTAGATGSIGLTGPKAKTFTVNVAATTVFVAKGMTTPTFANVCVGDIVAAQGALAGTTVAATKIFVSPPRPPRPPHVAMGAGGVVASVNSVTTAGTCGTAGAAGTFALTAMKGRTFTVNVTASTAFVAKGVTGPSFANVCVGAQVGAAGAVTGTTVAATMVFALPDHTGKDDGRGHTKPGSGAFGKGPAFFFPGPKAGGHDNHAHQGGKAPKVDAGRGHQNHA